MVARISIHLIALALTFTSAAILQADWKPEPLEHELEMSEALAACPESLREQAGAYVLSESGFVLAHQSGNGFHAIISRSQPGVFEPQCLDAEGSRSLLHQILLRGRLQMQGLDPDEIDSRIDSAWANGELLPPTRPGINYMLSERNRVPIAPDRGIPYQPHLMFYAPGLTNEDFGGSVDGTSPVFLINEGEPDAYVIVPVATRVAEPAADSE